MKMGELLKSIPTLDEAIWSLKLAEDADMSLFEQDLGTGTCIGWHQQFEDAVKRIGINTWVCTDTEVGVYAYYFEGVFMALSFQAARKSDVHICWVSKELATKVRELIWEIAGEHPFDVVLLDADLEVDEQFWLNKR